MKTAYLGDENSYSFTAAKILAQHSQLCAYQTLGGIFKALQSGEVDCAVAPIENNVEGSINETFDFLSKENFYIGGETQIDVKHKLIGFEDAEIGDIKKVYSHYQAIAQCRAFLTSLKNIDVQNAPSTSAALKNITDKSVAAIAQSALKNQKVLRENIADYPDNATRFILICPKPGFKGNKVSIVFTVANEPGALLRVLQAIADEGINMTRILSRPGKGKSKTYNFFVDFDFNAETLDLSKTLEKLSHKSSNLKFLGRY